MKKIICLLLAAVLCIGALTACSSDFVWDNEFGLSFDVKSLDYKNYDPDAVYDENGLLIDIVGLDYVTLPEDYNSLQVPADQLTTSEEELNNYLENIRMNYGVAEQITDRAVEDGDTVNIDYVGYVDGAAFSGGSTMNLGTDVTAGSTEYVDDFLDQIIGRMPGETFDIEVTFPDDYGDAVDTDGNPVTLSGADAVFVTTINYIHGEMNYPEMTDAWVKDTLGSSDLETVEELRDYVKGYYTERKMYDYVTNYLAENAVYAPIAELPRELLDETASMMLYSNLAYAESMGTTLDAWLELQGFDSAEAYLNTSAATIVEEVHTVLLIQALCEALDISSTADEAAEYLGSSYSTYTSNYGVNYTTAYVNTNLCFNTVFANATVVE